MAHGGDAGEPAFARCTRLHRPPADRLLLDRASTETNEGKAPGRDCSKTSLPASPGSPATSAAAVSRPHGRRSSSQEVERCPDRLGELLLLGGQQVADVPPDDRGRHGQDVVTTDDALLVEPVGSGASRDVVERRPRGERDQVVGKSHGQPPAHTDITPIPCRSRMMRHGRSRHGCSRRHRGAADVAGVDARDPRVRPLDLVGEEAVDPSRRRRQEVRTALLAREPEPAAVEVAELCGRLAEPRATCRDRPGHGTRAVRPVRVADEPATEEERRHGRPGRNRVVAAVGVGRVAREPAAWTEQGAQITQRRGLRAPEGDLVDGARREHERWARGRARCARVRAEARGGHGEHGRREVPGDAHVLIVARRSHPAAPLRSGR